MLLTPSTTQIPFTFFSSGCITTPCQLSLTCSHPEMGSLPVWNKCPTSKQQYSPTQSCYQNSKVTFIAPFKFPGVIRNWSAVSLSPHNSGDLWFLSRNLQETLFSFKDCWMHLCISFSVSGVGDGRISSFQWVSSETFI